MRSIKYILTLTGVLLSFLPIFSLEIKVTPGKLKDMISISADDAELKIKGRADGRDLLCLASLPPSVKKLDISELQITEATYSTPDLYGRYSYGAGKLPEYIFYGCRFETVVLPDGITEVSEGAFTNTYVSSVILPGNCRRICPYAFYNAWWLKEINIPSSIKEIGERAFAHCVELKEINLPKGVKLLGAEIFMSTAITSLDASGVSEFADYALAGMNQLKEVTVNENAASTEGLLLNGFSLSRVYGSPESVPDLYVVGSRILNVNEIISSAKEIGDYSFASSQFTYMVFPSGLSYIGEGAFANLPNLQSVDANLLEDNVPSVDENAFKGINFDKAILYVAPGTKTLWESHPAWGEFTIMEGESRLDEVVRESGISIKATGKNILISAEPVVGEYALYSTDGILLAKGNSSDSSITLDLSETDSGIVIVTIRNPGGSRSVSLLLP